VERLVNAASIEFAEQGFTGAAITAIAERADVAIGSMYRFFPDKAALADAVVQAYLHDALREFGPILASVRTVDDARPATRRLLRAAADLQRRHVGYYRLTDDLIRQSAIEGIDVVRRPIVDAFDQTLARIGVGSHRGLRRRVVTTVVELVRHTLARSPADRHGRAAELRELEELVDAYLARRLDLP
jgi:AcrR family transcriptional regulator